MPDISEHLKLVGSEAFAAASRAFFGPVTQTFPRGRQLSSPTLFSTDLGVGRLSEINADAHVVINNRRNWRSFDPDAIKVLLLIDGETRFEQDAISLDLQPHDAVVYDPVRPYRLENRTRTRQLILQIPRSNFGPAKLARLCRPMALKSRESGLTRIAAGMMQTVIAESHQLDAQGLRRVGHSLLQLIDGLLSGPVPAFENQASSLALLRGRIIAFVDANIGRFDLSAAEIARNMGCSRRYLHRAFEGEGATLERFIWNRRLERSRETLAHGNTASISEIAFSCGFNSSAHFSRAFKSRYKITPRQLRDERKAAWQPATLLTKEPA